MSVTSGAARAAGLMMMLCTAMGDANAAATILLWPIDPWLGSENKATELWIQNQGNTPATMQVRIVRWRQERGDERYQPQTDVVASPPIVTIQKGTKQLIRLIKQTEIPAGTEQYTESLLMKSLQPAHLRDRWVSNCKCVTPSRSLFMARGLLLILRVQTMRWWIRANSVGKSYEKMENLRCRYVTRVMCMFD